MTYNRLKMAVAPEWKREMLNDTNVLNYVIFTQYRVIIEDKKKQLIECSTKEVYWHYVSKIAERPTSENTWEEKVGLGFTNEQWDNTYTYPYKLTKNTRILEFQFKITHRILACKEKLCKWKIKDSEICDRFVMQYRDR
jgi:hypothetical protein